MNIPFPKSIAARIAKRAKALDMAPSAYVRQCILTELTKDQRSTVTSGKDTPAMNGAKKDHGCGEGYRWVCPMEILISGDEYKYGRKWKTTTREGEIAMCFRYYRRKV